MNDFLSSLVSKSLGVAPIIGPRPVSRFEPWQPGGMLATAQTIDRAEAERSLPQVESDTLTRLERPRHESYGPGDEAPRTPALPVESPPAVWMPAPVVLRPDEHAAPYELDVAAPIDQSLTSSADTAGTPSSVVSVVERIERVIVDRTQSDHDRIEPDYSAHARENRPLGVELIAHDDAARAPSNKVPIVERIGRAIVEHLPLQRVISEPERSDQAQITLPVIIQSMGTAPVPGAPDAQRATPARITPNVERIERIRENSAQNQVDRSHVAQATPPTIHVTIGRIEVRATTSAAPARQPQSRPRLSLDEYLRQRNGGAK